MLRSKVVTIDRGFYVRVPTEDARRLGIEDGDEVELDLHPLRCGTTADALALRGRFKRAFSKRTLSDVWGF